MTYALLSDLHFHDWSQFSGVTESGVNKRLSIIKREVTRAVTTLRAAGGDQMLIAGDIFHVRGKIKPSVMNPVLELFEGITAAGIDVTAIPGNHDLENVESDGLGNAIRALEGVGVAVCDEPTMIDERVLMVPWCSTLAGLKKRIADYTKGLDCSWLDCIIHAPLDGVIWGIPDHGLSVAEIAAWGFKRVFAGHYHHHIDLGRGVYSIGAVAHQTWSDVGTKAGFLMVGDDVTWHPSEAPYFVEVTGDEEDDADITEKVRGNYARVKLNDASEADIRQVREELEGMGALGAIVLANKKAGVKRTGATVTTGASLEASVAEYVVARKFGAPTSELCQRILVEAREAKGGE